jgi:signal transduction histidine kinase
MENERRDGPAAARTVTEALVRTVRHEVGDLLQTVYATSAILQKRLGAERELELRVLQDMKQRAETCRNFLDTAHDLVCPLAFNPTPVDLAELVRGNTVVLQKRFPAVEFGLECSVPVTIEADARRLEQVAEQVTSHAAEMARHVVINVSQPSASDRVEWTVTDDGPGLTSDQQGRVFSVFYATRQGRPGIGLALAQRLVLQHGGQITAENVQGGGLRMRISLPLALPDQAAPTSAA